MKDFWLDRWKNDDVPWHQSEVEPLLPKHSSLFKSKTILVPLCGKSQDLLWLSKNGFKVIGVELSEIASENFFKEANLPFEVVKIERFKVFKSNSIEIWCGDFFELPQTALPENFSIYDRAALIALPPNVQERYAKHIKELSHSHRNHFSMLVIGRVSEDLSIEGPPFRVSGDDLHALYGESFKIEKIDESVRLSRGSDILKLTETLYLVR